MKEAITSITQLQEKYPKFFPSKELFMYADISRYVPYIELICRLVQTKLFTHKTFIKMRVPDVQVGRGSFSHFSAPDDMYSFCFDQIKTKFGTARFYFSISYKPFEELPKELQERYDPESYNEIANENKTRLRNEIELLESMADSYDLVPLKK